MVADNLLLAGFGIVSLVLGGVLIRFYQLMEGRVILLPTEAVIKENAERFDLMLSLTIAVIVTFFILIIGNRFGLPGIRYIAGVVAIGHILVTVYVLGTWVQDLGGWR